MFPSTQVPHNGAVSATAAIGSNSNPTQSDTLMQENMRLRKELEVYVEKATRLQRVSEGVSSCLKRFLQLRYELNSDQPSNMSWLTENLQRQRKCTCFVFGEDELHCLH